MWMSLIGFSHWTKGGPELSQGRNQNWERSFFVYSCLSLVRSLQRVDRVLVRWRGRRCSCGLQSFLKIQWLQLHGMGVYLFVATTLSSIRLKSCCKSEWLTWRSPSGVVARWPPAVLFVRAPAHLLERRLADRSLAEWLTSDWGALWWSCQACRVVFSWQWLSRRTQKHIRMQLPISSVQNFFLPPTGSAAPFIFPGPSRQEKWWWEHMVLQVYKKATLAKCASAGERDQTFCCQGGK